MAPLAPGHGGKGDATEMQQDAIIPPLCERGHSFLGIARVKWMALGDLKFLSCAMTARTTSRLAIRLATRQVMSRHLYSLADLGRTLMRDLFDPYRPELHYMRGPGPKWREKHARAADRYPAADLARAAV
jgi:hypothetical protein